MDEGAWIMDWETMWRLFLATGLPEAYSLYALLREEAERAEESKTA